MNTPTMTAIAQQRVIYEGKMNDEPRKSIRYFEEKNNPVKHILALCSILWQGNCGKMSAYI
jgi:hypothetical protein